MFCCQTFEVWQSLTQTVVPKASCLYVFDQRIPLIFHFSQPCLQKLFLMSKNSCKKSFFERKQIKSTTADYSKLWMFGGTTCHVCTQLEHGFSSRVHASMQLMVSENKLQDTFISSPSHYLSSGYLLWTLDNLNCFWFPLNVQVMGSRQYDGCKFNTTLLTYSLAV